MPHPTLDFTLYDSKNQDTLPWRSDRNRRGTAKWEGTRGELGLDQTTPTFHSKWLGCVFQIIFDPVPLSLLSKNNLRSIFEFDKHRWKRSLSFIDYHIKVIYSIIHSASCSSVSQSLDSCLCTVVRCRLSEGLCLCLHARRNSSLSASPSMCLLVV